MTHRRASLDGDTGDNRPQFQISVTDMEQHELRMADRGRESESAERDGETGKIPRAREAS